MKSADKMYREKGRISHPEDVKGNDLSIVGIRRAGPLVPVLPVNTRKSQQPTTGADIIIANNYHASYDP